MARRALPGCPALGLADRFDQRAGGRVRFDTARIGSQHHQVVAPAHGNAGAALLLDARLLQANAGECR